MAGREYTKPILPSLAAYIFPFAGRKAV